MNWDDALRSIWKKFSSPPVWAISDCCMFAAAYVKARTGVDHAVKFDYEDERGALKIIAQNGGDIANVIESCIGQPHEGAPVIGDLVMFNAGAIRSVGVFSGYCVCGIHPDLGLARVEHYEITQAWSL